MYTVERQQIERTLKSLRQHFTPGTPDLEILSQVLQTGPECNPKTVEAFARAKKRFSTADVMQHFQVSKYKVAGSLAALRRAGKIEPAETTDDSNYTSWVWVRK